MKRQLAAILYADVAGYSRLTGIDEEATHQKLDASLNLLTDIIGAHGGQKVHEAGDAILAEFQSVTEAVDSSVEFQLQMSTRNEGLTEDECFAFRIGVHLGEVIHDRDDIYGDGVISRHGYKSWPSQAEYAYPGRCSEQVEGQVEQSFEDLGYRKFKNISQSIHVYQIRLSGSSELHPMQALLARAGGMPPVFDDEVDKPPLVTGRCLCGAVTFENHRTSDWYGCLPLPDVPASYRCLDATHGQRFARRRFDSRTVNRKSTNLR